MKSISTQALPSGFVPVNVQVWESEVQPRWLSSGYSRLELCKAWIVTPGTLACNRRWASELLGGGVADPVGFAHL